MHNGEWNPSSIPMVPKRWKFLTTIEKIVESAKINLPVRKHSTLIYIQQKYSNLGMVFFTYKVDAGGNITCVPCNFVVKCFSLYRHGQHLLGGRRLAFFSTRSKADREQEKDRSWSMATRPNEGVQLLPVQDVSIDRTTAYARNPRARNRSRSVGHSYTLCSSPTFVEA